VCAGRALGKGGSTNKRLEFRGLNRKGFWWGRESQKGASVGKDVDHQTRRVQRKAVGLKVHEILKGGGRPP